MRKLSYVLIILIAVLGLMVTPAVLAQDTSDGCSELSSVTGINDSSTSGDFFAGETLTFEVVGALPAATTWTVTINGTDELSGSTDLSFTFEIPVDDTYTIATSITGTAFEIGLSCTPEGEEGEVTDFTLCHRPPGNPQAAHTITVGSENAYNTHLNNHGDEPGMCPPGEESRFLDDAAGYVIFIILDDPTDDEETTEAFNLWGECEEGACESLVTIYMVDIVALVGTLDINGFVSFDLDDDDGYEVRVYYLGFQDRNGDGTFHDVFQINIYFNGVISNDDVLILVADGVVAGWELNADIGVDISILFGSGDSDDDDADDSDDSDDTDDSDEDDGDDADDSDDDDGA